LIIEFEKVTSLCSKQLQMSSGAPLAWSEWVATFRWRHNRDGDKVEGQNHYLLETKFNTSGHLLVTQAYPCVGWQKYHPCK